MSGWAAPTNPIRPLSKSHQHHSPASSLKWHKTSPSTVEQPNTQTTCRPKKSRYHSNQPQIHLQMLPLRLSTDLCSIT